jgi:hypothetical protein
VLKNVENLQEIGREPEQTRLPDGRKLNIRLIQVWFASFLLERASTHEDKYLS